MVSTVKTVVSVCRIGQVPRKHRCSDTAYFSLPSLGRAAKYVHHLQVEPTLKLLDLLAKSNALPLAVTEEQVTRPGIPPVGHRAKRSTQWSSGADVHNDVP
jgi:hypothetical protein